MSKGESTCASASPSRASTGIDNFWQDDVHKRGLWRRTSLDGYRSADPKWETLLDIDALGAGGEWMQRHGWVKAWGIGRHVLGSQLFSYHYDPSGFTVEHYIDGDVFDADFPTRWHEASKAGLYVWGPDLPDHFIDMAMTPARAAEVIHGLRTREDFTLGRLLAAKRAFSTSARPWSGKPVHRPKPA